LDVDTVEEGSEILVLDDCGLLDSSTELRDVFKVDALDSDVIFLFFLLGNSDSLGGIDSLVQLEAQKVLNFDSLNKKRYTVPLSRMLTTTGKWE